MKKSTLIASLVGVGAVAALAGVMVCKKLSDKKEKNEKSKYYPCGCKKDPKAKTQDVEEPEYLDITDADIASELSVDFEDEEDELKKEIEITEETKPETTPEI